MSSVVLALESAHPLLSAAPAAVVSPHHPAVAVSAHPQAAATLTPAMQKALETYGQQTTRSAFAMHYPWLAHTFAGLFIFSSIALILLLAIQTTKQEGLSGSVGGKVEATYRVRPGVEQQLARLTSAMAILFVLSATLVSLSGF